MHTRSLDWHGHADGTRVVAFALVACALLLTFIAIAASLTGERMIAYDALVMNAIHGVAAERYDAGMRMISKLGQNRGVVPLDIVLLVFLMARHRWARAQFWVAAVGGAALFALIANQLFVRARPDLWITLPETTSSFPSSHAMGSMAAVAALVLLLWPTRWRWPMLLAGTVFVFLVGLSRVYLGEHYPSDIVAGWAASLGWVTGIAALMRTRIGVSRGASPDPVHALVREAPAPVVTAA